jgi:hypothetical protein
MSVPGKAQADYTLLSVVPDVARIASIMAKKARMLSRRSPTDRFGVPLDPNP